MISATSGSVSIKDFSRSCLLVSIRDAQNLAGITWTYVLMRLGKSIGRHCHGSHFWKAGFLEREKVDLWWAAQNNAVVLLSQTFF